SDQPLVSPIQDIPAAIDRLLLTPEYVGDGFTEASPTLVERQLEVRQLPFLLIEIEVAGIASRLPLIRHAVTLIGDAIALLGHALALALAGDSLPLVVKRP